jgi:putative membrane protein
MLRPQNDARHADQGATSRWAVTPDGLDARNVMAAERTFLAWIRTCLTLLATGAATSSLPVLPGREVRGVVGLACVAATAPVAVVAHVQWRGWCTVAARHGLPRPHRTALLLISVVLLVTTTLAGAVSIRLVTSYHHGGPCRRPALCAAHT